MKFEPAFIHNLTNNVQKIVGYKVSLCLIKQYTMKA